MSYAPMYGGYQPYMRPGVVNEQQPQQMEMQRPVPAGYTCRPVTSRLEAEAMQVDYFGLGTIMPALNHDTIYLKRFNQNTGGTDFLKFVLQVDAEPVPVAFASMDDLEQLRIAVTRMENELEKLRKPTGRAVKKEDE